MFADVSVANPGAERGATVTVPRSAVQTVGDRQVVYLADPKEPGKFIEREVRLGRASREQVEVLSGVVPGNVVVTEGSLFLRAERERLGLRPPTANGQATTVSPARESGVAAVQTAKVLVTEQGFEPAQLTLRADTAACITFVRTTEKTCATEVVFPSLKTKRSLPLNEPVEIEVKPVRAEKIEFSCGMNMLHGTVVAR
jgi:hypothetical protein